MKTKIQKKYTDKGLGFPVVLKDVPMTFFDGEWTPDIDYNKIDQSVVISLVVKRSRLIGSEAKYIRLYFGFTQEELSSLLSCTKQEISVWEKSDCDTTGMGHEVEIKLRSLILEKIGVHLFYE